MHICNHMPKQSMCLLTAGAPIWTHMQSLFENDRKCTIIQQVQKMALSTTGCALREQFGGHFWTCCLNLTMFGPRSLYPWFCTMSHYLALFRTNCLSLRSFITNTNPQLVANK